MKLTITSNENRVLREYWIPDGEFRVEDVHRAITDKIATYADEDDYKEELEFMDELKIERKKVGLEE